MDVVLMKALQLILSLSILVVLHEGGHFFFSKLFHVKVELFNVRRVHRYDLHLLLCCQFVERNKFFHYLIILGCH